MLEFIQLLKQRYEAVLAHRGSEPGAANGLWANLNALTLAEAFIKKGELIGQQPRHPLQIAVIGPTQAGKSSLANLLLREPAAGVSPLAGYTVHPHGFCLGVDIAQCDWLESYFGHYQQRAPKDLPRDRHDCYALVECAAADGFPLPPCILWDTPDFDSIDAAVYRDSVLRVTALADVIVLAVSRDKYADQSVWEMMALLEPLGQPTVVVLNKLTKETREVVVESFREKWREGRQDKVPDIVTLSYHKQGALPELCRRELAPLSKQLLSACGQNPRRRQPRQAHAYLKAHWAEWLAPVTAEHNALEQWSHTVEQYVDEALALYRRDYLNHTQHYETFQLAIAELLTLLEIPGVAAALVQMRKILTWPVRQLLHLGKAGRNLVDNSSEVAILVQIGDHMMIRVAEAILEKCETDSVQAPWWREVGAQLRAEKPLLAQVFKQSVHRYYLDFQPEIEKTAHQLYARLQSQPATLNSLRATRVTTDAAAVALALKTGGIGVQDVFLTPAMLSITSLLMEGVLGSYMERVAADLKQRQYDRVKETLFNDTLKQVLIHLPEKMQGTEKFNIPLQTLAAAEAKLKQSRHGLRLL